MEILSSTATHTNLYHSQVNLQDNSVNTFWRRNDKYKYNIICKLFCNVMALHFQQQKYSIIIDYPIVHICLSGVYFIGYTIIS